jgi:abortive infection bacteriophage resistance protein
LTYPKTISYQMKRRSISIAVLGTPFGSKLPIPEACTVWEATDKSVEAGGALIANNRDWTSGRYR